MASSAPLMPFLRPMGLPRPQTVQRFLRFSTSAPCQAQSKTVRKNPREGTDAPPRSPFESSLTCSRSQFGRLSHRLAHIPSSVDEVSPSTQGIASLQTNSASAQRALIPDAATHPPRGVRSETHPRARRTLTTRSMRAEPAVLRLADAEQRAPHLHPKEARREHAAHAGQEDRR